MLRVQVVWTGLGAGEGYTRFHFSGTGSVFATAASVKVATFLDDIAENLHVNTEATVSSEVLDINAATGEVDDVHIVTPANVPGLAAGNPVSNSDQALIRLRTGSFRGARRILGRINIPGISDNLTVGGELQPLLRTRLKAAADTLMGGSGDPSWGVYSPPRSEPLFQGGILADVLETEIWNEFAVLRSRRS